MPLVFAPDDPRRALRATIVNAFRPRRSTPRPNMDPTRPTAWTDPAPDWVWQLVDTILVLTGAEPGGGAELVTRAVAWCEKGDAELRSAQLRQILRMWVGPKLPALRLFLTNAEKTGAGCRPVGTTKMGRGRLVKAGVHESLIEIDQVDGLRFVPNERLRPLLMMPPGRAGDRVRVLHDPNAARPETGEEAIASLSRLPRAPDPEATVTIAPLPE